jgi:hypothetical protein
MRKESLTKKKKRCGIFHTADPIGLHCGDILDVLWIGIFFFIHIVFLIIFLGLN